MLLDEHWKQMVNRSGRYSKIEWLVTRKYVYLAFPINKKKKKKKRKRFNYFIVSLPLIKKTFTMSFML